MCIVVNLLLREQVPGNLKNKPLDLTPVWCHHNIQICTTFSQIFYMGTCETLSVGC